MGMSYEIIVKILADGLILPIVLIGAYALLFKIKKGHRFEAYARILMAGITAFLLAKFIATLYQPAGERPFELMKTVAGASYLDNPGFPSDHVLFTAAITLAVWFETKSKQLTITLVILTLLVGVGRVIALVHTPVDVIGGLVVACLGAGWYLTAHPSTAKRRVQ